MLHPILFTVLFISTYSAPILWAGGVTSNSANFRVAGFSGDEFVVSESQDLSSPIFVQNNLQDIESFHVSALNSSTVYFYGVVDKARGSFKTFPTGEAI